MDASSPGAYWPSSIKINFQEYATSIRWKDYDNLIGCAAGEPVIRVGKMISSGGYWDANTAYEHMLIPVKAGDAVTVQANGTGAQIAFIERPDPGYGNKVVFASGVTGRTTLSANARGTYTVPSFGNFLYALTTAGTKNNYLPVDIIINGVSILRNTRRLLRGVFQYTAGSFMSGDATARLIVAMPQGNHYTGFTMYRYVVNATNCDVWRIQSFNTYNDSLTVVSELSVNGELECAVRLNGRSDFSGGSTHGDEVMTGWEIFLDGKRITGSLSGYTGVTPFEELRLVRQSNLYDPADSTTLIALHGCEYVFTLDGLRINQSLEWKVADTLAACYMAMFTPKKTVTNRFYSDLDFTPVTLSSSSYEITKAGAKKAVIYDNGGAFWASFSVERYPTGLTGGDRLLVTDNGGNSYNKCYFVITNGGSSTVGQLWQTTTAYQIKA